MKTLFSFFAALLLTSATYAQQTVATDPMQDPTALGNAFFKSLLDEDGATLGKLLASDFSLTSLDGQAVDGDLIQQAVNGGYLVVETATVTPIQTRQYNNDAAIMTGTWKVKGSVQGNAIDATAAFSLVSAKQSGAWKVVNVQFTPTR